MKVPNLENRKEQSEALDEIPMELVKSAVATAAILDSISLFELLGAKWMLAVTEKYWNAEIHEHAMDEVRHTKVVQDAAKELRWAFSTSDLVRERDANKICYKATEEYLSKLSRRVFRMALSNNEEGGKKAIASYALLAFLIERRIMKIYPHFAKNGPTEGIRQMAKALIVDERKHLTFVTNKLPAGLTYADSSQDEIIKIEAQLASEWMTKIRGALEH